MPNINTTKLSSPSRIQSGTYKKTMKCFFFQSKLIEAQITELFDDLWPTVTALKNLRWQVNGYYHELLVKQNAKLAARFVDSEDKTNRPNLYRACIEQTWEQQEYNISRNLLTNIFALFEGWIEMILPVLGISERKSKDLQFPDKARNTLVSFQQRPNVTLVDAFYDVYVLKNSGSQLVHLENYLKIYRYFKECRNCVIHSGGRTDQKLIDAYAEVAGLTAVDLDVNELPVMEPVARVNDLIKLSLRGVVGFSQIVIKLVEVMDTELIKAERAVDCFVSQVKEYTPYAYTLSQDKHKAEKKIEGIMRSAGFLPPRHSDAFLQMLRNKGIIRL